MTQATIRIPTPLRTFTNGASQLQVEASTVREALQAAGAEHEELLARILDDAGELRTFVNLFLGSKNISQLEGLDTPVANGDVLSNLPAVAGGIQ